MSKAELMSKIIIVENDRKTIWASPYAEVGMTLRKIRRSTKMNEKQLANILGVSQARVSQYEMGKKIPSLKVIKKYLNACGKEFKMEIQ